jgi:amino acid transporter
LDNASFSELCEVQPPASHWPADDPWCDRTRLLALHLPSLSAPAPGGFVTSFSTYLFGFIVLILGLAMAAYLLNVPPLWITVGVIVLIGLGILMATTRTKPKDPPGVS